MKYKLNNYKEGPFTQKLGPDSQGLEAILQEVISKYFLSSDVCLTPAALSIHLLIQDGLLVLKSKFTCPSKSFRIIINS